MQDFPTKLQWKRQTKTAISGYWTRTLVEEGTTKSTLQHCCLKNMQIGKVHRVWDSVMPNLQDVRRAHIKARILTGTYMLQSTKVKFNNQEVDPKCPLCRLDDEDLVHFILKCPALANIREIHIKDLRALVIGKVGQEVWSKKFCSRGGSRISIKGVQIHQEGVRFPRFTRLFINFPKKLNVLAPEGGSSEPPEPPLNPPLCSETVLLSLIIDCQTLVEKGILPACVKTLNMIESSSRTLCFKLHLQRLNLHKQLL